MMYYLCSVRLVYKTNVISTIVDKQRKIMKKVSL